MNIQSTGIYTNTQNSSKSKVGKQRPDSLKASIQQKAGSLYDEEIKYGNQRTLDNPSLMHIGGNNKDHQPGKSMGEPEKNML